MKAQAKQKVKPKTKSPAKPQPQSIIPKKDIRREIDAKARTEKRSSQTHGDIPQVATPQSDYIAPSNRNRAALTDTPEPQANRIMTRSRKKQQKGSDKMDPIVLDNQHESSV